MKIPSSIALLFLVLGSSAPAAVVAQTFAPGNLEGWSQIVIGGGTGNDYRFFATGATFGNRMQWTDPTGSVGGLTVTTSTDTDARNSAHNSAVLRSPTFALNGTNLAAGMTGTVSGISFNLLGGMGTSVPPTAFSAIPANSLEQPSGNYIAFLGVGLRRVGDDAYLLWGRRTANAQSGNWQTTLWDEAALAAATAGDAPGTLYTLDLIDAAHGDWGWVAMDQATFTLNTVPEISSAALLLSGLLPLAARRRRA